MCPVLQWSWCVQFMQAAGLADRDLLDVRYEGEVPHVLPYFIAVDEASRSLVLAIRGGLKSSDEMAHGRVIY